VPEHGLGVGKRDRTAVKQVNGLPGGPNWGTNVLLRIITKAAQNGGKAFSVCCFVQLLGPMRPPASNAVSRLIASITS
jgi:hypothetical protein